MKCANENKECVEKYFFGKRFFSDKIWKDGLKYLGLENLINLLFQSFSKLVIDINS